MGCIVFSPLAQGLLTNKYLNGIPEGFTRREAHLARSGRDHARQGREGEEAQRDRQGAAASRWRRWPWPGRCATRQVTSSLIGASKVAHVEEAVGALNNLEFSASELASIESA